MIDFARETVGIVLPAADLVYRNALPLMMQDVSLAVVVGKAVIGGVKCDHLLFSRPGVDFQIWIARKTRCRWGPSLQSLPARLHSHPGGRRELLLLRRETSTRPRTREAR